MEELVRERTANLQQRTIELEEEKARTQTLLKGMIMMHFYFWYWHLFLDLKVAKEAAETAAASKQSFLANMSHGKSFITHIQCPSSGNMS